jgi:Mg-chelatase subunit ChlD
VSRRQLAAHASFEQVSPEVGVLDEAAFDGLFADDPDAALAMLADVVGATDRRLSDLARRLAGRLFIDVSRRGMATRAGIGRIETMAFRPEFDLDVDASLDALIDVDPNHGVIDVDRLRVRGWGKRSTALCLLVDRSGSMGGRPLATSALAAAAVACRQPDDYSVVAFAADAVVAKSQDRPKDVEQLIVDVLALRGFGITDVVSALHVAAEQLSRSSAGRKVTVLLSDCRHTAQGDPVAARRLVDELVVVAPETDADEARAFARAVGAVLATVAGPADVPRAINDALAAR